MPAAPDALPPGDHGRVRFREERDVGAVISSTFTFLREVWKELGLGLLYIAGPVVLLTGVASFFLQTRMMTLMQELEASVTPGTPPEDPSAVFDTMGQAFGPSYVLALLGSVVAGLLVTAVIYGYVRLYRAGAAGRITPGVLWGEASHLVGRSALVWITVGFAGLVCGALVVFLCLGLVAFVALLPTLALAMPVALLGDRRADDAFAEAWGLARVSWGGTLGVVVLSGVIWYAFNLLLSLPASVGGLMMGLGAASAEEIATSSTMRTLMAVGTVLGSFAHLFYAIPLVATALQYFNLLERQQGGGLKARVDHLFEEPADPRTPPAPTLPPPPLPRPSDAPRPDAGRPDAGHPGFHGSGFDDEERA